MNGTFEWGVVIATLVSVLSVVPRHCTLPPPLSFPAPCPSPPLVLPQGGMGDHHLVNPKRAKPWPKGAVQSIPVEKGEHLQEFKVKRSRTKKFYTERIKE